MAIRNSKLFKISPMKLSLLIGIIAIICHFCIEVPLFSSGPLSQIGFIHELELKFLDLKFKSRAERHKDNTEALPPSKVVIVGEDEKSIERYGLLPWSRNIIGDLVNSLTQAGAKVIAFDIVFSEPDRNSAYQTIVNFEKQYREDLNGDENNNITKLANDLAGAGQDNQDIIKAYEQLQSATAQNAKKLRQLSKKKNQRGALQGAVELEKLSKNLQQSIKKMQESQKQLEALHQQSLVVKTRLDTYEDELATQVANVSPDAAFAKAISEASNLILGYFCFATKEEMTGIGEEEAKRDIERIQSVAINKVYNLNIVTMGDQEITATKEVTGDGIIDNIYLANLCQAVGVQAPLDIFASATPYKGFFNANPDFDGPLRRTTLIRRLNGQLIPHLALLSAALYQQAKIQPILDDFDPTVLDSLYLGDQNHRVPIDKHGLTIINYYTDPIQYFPMISAVDVIDGKVDPSLLKDKIVLVGAIAIGTYDQRVTPFSSFTPGVYVNAMTTQNIVDNKYLMRPLGWPIYEYIFMIFFALFLGWLYKKLPVSGGIFAAFGLMAIIFAIDIFYIFDNGYWAHIMMPIMQCLLTYIAVTIYRFLTEEREKKQIRNAFQFYLSRSVVDEVLKDTTKLRLSGERRELTVLFSDIRGFTTISEGLTPEQLSNLLNEYLSPMTELVFDYEGTLDKYMGDAIMAFFGAPVSYQDHALRGCTVALAMMAKLHELQKGWKERGLPIINIGIGLNTGDMAVGNMGSNIRFDYTVMGDNVNLGSRLEGINKQYKTNIVISEFTYRAAGNGIYARELDAVRVKGKKEPVTIYELRGLGQAPEAEAKWITSFSEGIKLYKAQQWDEAITIFKALLAEKNDDYPCELYIDRCEKMKLNPPGEDWDGVFTMTTK